MSENRFNSVAILDAIPEGELNTARRLREDLEVVAASLQVRLIIQYFRIETVAHLTDCIDSLLTSLGESGIMPMIHFEGHGYSDENRIASASGEPCTWEQLKELITPLNAAMGLNLLLVLAACYGGSFVRAIRTTDRAPVWGLIGPTSVF